MAEMEIDHITIRPDAFGWTIEISVVYHNGGTAIHEYGIGDAIQFHAEVERTIGHWLADGPDDFHNAPDPTEIADQAEREYNAYREENQ